MKTSSVIWFLVLSSLFAWIISAGLNAQEIQECNRWIYEAQGRKNWYSTELQRAQCHAHGITLPDVPAYLNYLKLQDPVTLLPPVRSDFYTESNYQHVKKRFEMLGYWAAEAPQH